MGLLASYLEEAFSQERRVLRLTWPFLRAFCRLLSRYLQGSLLSAPSLSSSRPVTKYLFSCLLSVSLSRLWVYQGTWSIAGHIAGAQ